MNLKIAIILFCFGLAIGSCTALSIEIPTQATQLFNPDQSTPVGLKPLEDVSGLPHIISKDDGMVETVQTSPIKPLEFIRRYQPSRYTIKNDPIVTVIFGEPKHNHFRYQNNQWYFGIGPSTPIILHAFDALELMYELYTAEVYGSWVFEYSVVIQDNIWPDFNPDSGVITTFLFMNESCWHQLHYQAFNRDNKSRLCDSSSYEQVEYLVDAEKPTTTSSYTQPHYFDAENQFMWITNQTKKQLIATDTGCNPQDSGVYTIDWWLTKNVNGAWIEVNRGIVYDNDVNDTDGTPAHPWHTHQGGLWAIDYENRAYTFMDTNRNGSYDPGESILCHDPDGDGFIAIPQKGDLGGLFALDTYQESFTFFDMNSDFIYDSHDFILQIDADNDGIPSEPYYGVCGGIYTFDNTSEPYTFLDLNNNWNYDRGQDGFGEPIASLKPDADGAGTIHTSIRINDDGEYHIYHQTVDLLGNHGTVYEEYVRADNTPPTTTNSTETPHFYYYDKAIKKHVFCVTPQTPITLHSIDQEAPCDVGVDYFHYEIWFENNKTIEKNVTLFAEETFFIQEECIHELRWYAVDTLGNREKTKNQTYRVDNTPPQIFLSRGDPLIPEDDYYWVNKTTAIIIDAQDPGCCPFYTVQFRLNRGTWHTITHQLPFILHFPDECIYELDVLAFDVVSHVDRCIELYYVDDTPPQFSIIKPADGWYTSGSSIPAIISAVDAPNPDTPCDDELAVGISSGHPAAAFLLDAFPSFHSLFLDGAICGYDLAQQKFLGNLIIPQNMSFEDGPVLFGTCISDDLGNVNDSLHVLYDYYLESDGDENLFTQLIQPLLSTHQVTYVGIDTTPPIITITKPSEGSTIGPEAVEITAYMHDNLSGINTETMCHVYLDQMLLGILTYDPVIRGCNGSLSIPDTIPSGKDVAFTICVTDVAGNRGNATTLVDLTTTSPNSAPLAVIDSILPNPAAYNWTVQFVGRGTDPDGTITGYQWRSSLQENLSTNSSFNLTNMQKGNHTIFFKVKDNNNTWSMEVSQILRITHYNRIPRAVIDSVLPQIVKMNKQVSFKGHGNDTDGTVVGYRWWSNRSGVLSHNATFNTSGLSKGNHTIFFKVMDNTSYWSEAVQTWVLVLENVPPVARISGPAQGSIGIPLQFDGTSSSDEDGSIVSWLWEFGDRTNSTLSQPTHTYSQAGTYQIRLTVIDDSEKKANTTAQIIIAQEEPFENQNRAPLTATIEGPTEGTIRKSYEFTVTASDPDFDPLFYKIVWGDGKETTTEFSNSNTPLTVEHSWEKAGTYTINITTIDINYSFSPIQQHEIIISDAFLSGIDWLTLVMILVVIVGVVLLGLIRLQRRKLKIQQQKPEPLYIQNDTEEDSSYQRYPNQSLLESATATINQPIQKPSVFKRI